MAFVGVACPELDLSTAIQRKEGAVLAHGGAVQEPGGSGHHLWPATSSALCCADTCPTRTSRFMKGQI